MNDLNRLRIYCLNAFFITYQGLEVREVRRLATRPIDPTETMSSPRNRGLLSEQQCSRRRS